nr:Flp pilus assembly protein CpaB [bacterium]
SAMAAVLFASAYMNKKEAQVMRTIEPVPVAAAARDIRPGEMIDETAVTLASVPRKFAQPAAFASVREAAGRVAAVAIKGGSHLTPANAVRPSARGGVAPLLSPGMRAMPLSLADEAAVRIVKPGDLVDVIATFDLGAESSVRRTTLTVLENAQVLAVGGEVADSTPGAEAAESKGGIFGGMGRSPVPRADAAVALEVTPQEAQALAFSQESGSLRISVRPPFEPTGSERAKPTTISTITGEHGELVPVRRGYREYKGR